MLTNYEEGFIRGKVKLNKKWWEFWVPNYVEMDVGSYTMVGPIVEINIKIGSLYITGHSKDGSLVGEIKGLP